MRLAARLVFGILLSDTAPCPSAYATSLLPLVTQEARTLPSGTVESILGASYANNPRFPLFTPPGTFQSQEVVSAPGVGLNVGAGGWAEIQASFEMLYLNETRANGAQQSEYGNGDARLWTKVQLLREDDRWPGLGLRFGTKLPNASKEKGLGTDEIDFGIEALISKQFGPIATHANLGIALLDNPGPPIRPSSESSDGQDDLFTYAVAVVTRSLTGEGEGDTAVRLLAEAVGFAGSRFDNDRAAIRFGSQIRRGAVALYLGSGIGLVSGSEDFGFNGGLIYSFELERLFGAAD